MVLDNGNSLDQVLKRSGILPRTVHKEPGIILRKKCSWNSQRSPTMRHVSRTHRVALDWLFDRIFWIEKLKSNTSTPKNNSQTPQPKEISHLMSGIICCACSISAISVLQLAPLQWQNELNKDQERNVSQPDRDL